jgi:type IV pilus assembly protein PilY1
MRCLPSPCATATRNLGRGAAALLLAAWCASAHAEDIDLYSASQASSAGLPTVIVVLDNTANWGSTIGATKKFNVVQTALAAAVNAQPVNTLRIGLMLFN